jgi:TolB-like protein/tetratricopeptide (TPR) repeat protein
MRFLFGSHVLDIAQRELRLNAEPVALEPLVFDLLAYLVVHRDRVVSKDEVLDAIWSGRIVSDSALATRISAARRAIGDSGEAQRLIRTIVRKGFRFIGEVHEEQVAAQAEVSTASATGPTFSELPDKPSIAVLPFQNMSGDQEQEYFVDGMVEEIITALARIRWLFVIARNSSFTYKGQAIDVKQVGRALGVRYILEGSVRKAAGRVRITAQLIHSPTGTHLWADRFDGSLEDVFELQDKVASSVAGVIEPTLQAAETRRAIDRPTHDLTAYDLYLRAYPMLWSSARVEDALGLLEQAIARDPRYGPALAWAAECCIRLFQDGRSKDSEALRQKGIDFARRALEVADDDPSTLANAADALSHLGEDIYAMMALVDRALRLNPSFARGWHISGVLRMMAGQLDMSIEHEEAALRLSPRARVGSSFLVLGMAHFLSRRFDEAVPKLLLAIQDNPDFAEPYRVLAACYAHMGRSEDARKTVAKLRVISPTLQVADGFLRNDEHRELFLSGLRLATGEE